MLLNWNLNQYQAAGRHVLSYGAGMVTVAAAWGLVSASDAGTLTASLNDIYNGAMQLGKGIAGLTAVLVPIYTAWRAAHTASPSEQVKLVVANLTAPPATQTANAIADPSSRKELVNAVAQMPEVKGIVAPALADATLSPKVVATPEGVKI